MYIFTLASPKEQPSSSLDVPSPLVARMNVITVFMGEHVAVKIGRVSFYGNVASCHIFENNSKKDESFGKLIMIITIQRK